MQRGTRTMDCKALCVEPQGIGELCHMEVWNIWHVRYLTKPFML